MCARVLCTCTGLLFTRQEFTQGWWQLPLQGWRPVPASSLKSPRQHLWHKHILYSTRFCCILWHSTASWSILLNPIMLSYSPLPCHRSRIHLLFLTVLVPGRSAAFPTSPPWLIQRWQPNVSGVVYSVVAFGWIYDRGNLGQGDGSILGQCVNASPLWLWRTGERNAECQDLWSHMFIKEMKRKKTPY